MLFGENVGAIVVDAATAATDNDEPCSFPFQS